MLVYIAQDGVTTTDLFRRPGNPTDAKTIMKKMSEGKEVDFSSYNFYTLATVLKVIKKPPKLNKHCIITHNYDKENKLHQCCVIDHLL